ncbi:MAG: EVE domain-containing protein [Candidatus Eremiobacteraeota bacterium]|nr:EVE domain-containing protein [Candidatus Eremiobacteraeota bacterium]NNM92509.1 EVE domain-containing protein [Candidatus Eremiobacteraeota bacterium]
MPKYWLLKSEPQSYSIEDLQRDRTTPWSGVRNYQARNFMQAMSIGDEGFFYHSSCAVPGIVGICRVVRAAYPDATAFDPRSEYFDPKSSPEKPRWFNVEVAFVRAFSEVLPLTLLRERPALAAMPLLQRGQRLSVQPVRANEWRAILKLVRA